MEVKEFQKVSAGIVDTLDRKFGLERDAQLTLSQMLEELGELAQAANLQRLRKKEPDIANLEEEFADVFTQLAKLADLFGIDLEKSVLEKIEALKKRHGV